MRVAVVGGTGVVGRHVVASLAAAGHEPVVVARSTGVDLLGGRGLAAALEGAGAVVDVANVTTTSGRRARAFFEQATANLLRAEQEAGVAHHVDLSIVGVDRVPFGYYVAKRRQEELVRGGPVPWTILRATQFHEFAGQLAARSRGPLVVVPVMVSQPVAAREVGLALAELAVGPPLRAVTELAGPEVHRMPDLTRRLLRARGSRRRVLPLRVPGAAGRAMAGDGLLPHGPARLGTQTYDDWLGR